MTYVIVQKLKYIFDGYSLGFMLAINIYGLLIDIKKDVDVAKENNPDANIVETNIKDIKISPYMDLNIERLKEAFTDCADVVYKDFTIGEKLDTRLTLVYIDGMIDKNLVTENVTKALMLEVRQTNLENVKENLYETMKKASISASEMKDVDYLEEVIDSILEGDTALFVDNYEQTIIIGSRGWEMRGLQEPQSEALVRGPRDGFNETIKTNITLVRRRIRDTKLKVKMMKIGRRSKTDIALLYIDDIVDKRIIKEIEQRLARIDTDMILEGIPHHMNTNLFIPMTLEEVISATKQGATMIPKITASDTEVRIAGSAVIKNNKFLSWLGEEETKAVAFIRGDAKKDIIEIDYKGVTIPYIISDIKQKKSARIEDGQINIDLKLTMAGNIQQYKVSEKPRFTDLEIFKSIEKLINEEITKNLNSTIDTLQNDMNADVIKIGKHLKSYEPKMWEQIEGEWNEVFPKVKINVHIDAFIDKVGSIK